MTRPLISVVIPLYNAEPYIGDALRSVLGQGEKSLEVIVVDDGSTDGSASVVSEFASVTLLSQSNAGIGAARNTGMRAASAEFVSFLDADDLWPAGRLKALVGALRTGYDAVSGQVVEFGESRPETEAKQALLAGSMLIRRGTCLRVGEFREGLRVGEFIDWWARAEEANVRWTQIPEVVLRRRIHSTNTGIVQAANRVDYARVLRAALDRRRGVP